MYHWANPANVAIAFPLGAIPDGLFAPRASICAPEGGYRLAVLAPRLNSFISVPTFIEFPDNVIRGRTNPVPEATVVAIFMLAFSGVAVHCVVPAPERPVISDFESMPP